jgi:hypothetical protein
MLRSYFAAFIPFAADLLLICHDILLPLRSLVWLPFRKKRQDNEFLLTFFVCGVSVERVQRLFFSVSVPGYTHWGTHGPPLAGESSI